jgi:hypothetical protein
LFLQSKGKFDDDIKNDRVLENINTHPIALCENLELQDINTEVMENENE